MREGGEKEGGEKEERGREERGRGEGQTNNNSLGEDTWGGEGGKTSSEHECIFCCLSPQAQYCFNMMRK